MTDAREVRQKIVSFIRAKGPSLPVHISKECNINSLFAGAFLSELANENQIKISNLKVGGSPLYFTAGQESMIEKFYTYLPGKEKEAFLLLKEQKIMQDRKQEPAIRVALREIRDFAVSFHDDNELWWRFHSIKEDEAAQIFEKIKAENENHNQEISRKIEKEIKPMPESEFIKEIKQEITREPIVIARPQLDIGLETQTPEKSVPEEISLPEEKIKKIPFMEQFKKFAESRGMHILNIDKAGKKEIFARIKSGNRETLAYVIDRKKVLESDILKAHKKASQLQIPFKIISKGDLPKKTREFLKACENMEKMEMLPL